MAGLPEVREYGQGYEQCHQRYRVADFVQDVQMLLPLEINKCKVQENLFSNAYGGRGGEEG